jgi:hypothetical protein
MKISCNFDNKGAFLKLQFWETRQNWPDFKKPALRLQASLGKQPHLKKYLFKGEKVKKKARFLQKQPNG